MVERLDNAVGYIKTKTRDRHVVLTEIYEQGVKKES